VSTDLEVRAPVFALPNGVDDEWEYRIAIYRRENSIEIATEARPHGNPDAPWGSHHECVELPMELLDEVMLGIEMARTSPAPKPPKVHQQSGGWFAARSSP